MLSGPLATVDPVDLDHGELLEAGIEIALLWWFFYVVLKFLSGTRGLAIMKGALMGMASIVLAIILLAQVLEMDFARLQVAGIYMLQFMAVVLIVLFQPELRRGFTRLSEAGGRGGRSGRKRGSDAKREDIVASIEGLARRGTGALVVFEQHTGIQGLLDSGVPIDAELTGALLESIFYPKSPLHDGAVIVRDGRIVAASCMLPLTEDPTVSRELGTRHRAAIGVTEESDAVVVVVSEETGAITVSQRGHLQPMADGAELDGVLAEAVTVLRNGTS